LEELSLVIIGLADLLSIIMGLSLIMLPEDFGAN